MLRCERGSSLSRRYVCPRWSFDAEGGERTLRYFRSVAAGEPDDPDEWLHALRWLHTNGQSVQWVLAGDPCVMICHAAAMTY